MKVLWGLLVLVPVVVSGQSIRIKVKLDEKVEFQVQEVVLTSVLTKDSLMHSKDEVELSEFHYDKIDPVTFTIHYPRVPKLKTGQYDLFLIYRINQSDRDQVKRWKVSVVQNRHIYTEARFSKEELAE